ncbi:hypothetical protein [Spirochaeta dissipatitropha]
MIKSVFICVLLSIGLAACASLPETASRIDMIIDDQQVRVIDDSANTGTCLEQTIAADDLYGTWQIVIHEVYDRRAANTYDLVFLDQNERSRRSTKQWKSQGFQPIVTSVEHLKTMEFKEDGTMLVAMQLLVDGEPASQTHTPDWPWTWEHSDDNTRVLEFRYQLSEKGLEVKPVSAIGFYPRLHTSNENDSEFYTQRLCYRQYRGETYLYIGGYGLLSRPE